MVFLGQAGGHDADHALVPGFPGEDDGVRLCVGAEHGGGLLIDAGLDLLPLAVEPAEAGCQDLRLRRVVRQEEVERHADLAHASGRVDARGEQIADRGGRDRLAEHAAFLHQGGYAGALRRDQRLKSAHDHRPHLAVQRHDVRHEPQRKQVGVTLEHGRLVAGYRGGELEGDAHAGQPGVRIAAVRAVGVDDRDRVGKLLLALVVVGDDEVDAELSAQLRLVVGRDSAVHRDDQIDLLAAELADGDLVEAVALLEPRRDVGDDPRADALEKVSQQGGRGDAVDVIVAEDGDLFPPGNGQTDAVGRGFHVLHQEGRVERGVAAQIVRGVLRTSVSARGKSACAERAVAGSFKRTNLVRARLRNVPGSKLHKSTHPKIFFLKLYHSLPDFSTANFNIP